MPKNNIYTVTKVEHEFGPTKIKPKFSKMPELYLELLINKKKVNLTLASEKYVHHYEPLISSEESPVNFKSIPQITSISRDIHRDRTRGTFRWESSDSIEPSPILTRKISRPRSSSPQVNSNSISSTRYRRIKKSIIASYCNTINPNNTKVENEPPPLKEIKKAFGENNPKVIVNYEEIKDEDDQKRELLFKFKRLAKTYPKADIPHFDMMSNHDNMKKMYDSTIKNLAIDSTVETYKSYLMMGFMGCEIVLGKIGFDMEGYTQQQTLYMTKYEKLLVELGEKSYVPSAISKWPVEIRIIALILFQTTIFIVSKIIAKKTNVNLLQMYNNINGAYETHVKYNVRMNSSGFASGGSSPLTFIPKTKRPTSSTSDGKMKGPSVTKES